MGFQLEENLGLLITDEQLLRRSNTHVVGFSDREKVEEEVELFEKIKTNNSLKLMKDVNLHIHKNLQALGKISKNEFLPRHNIEYKTQTGTAF